jgi:hypothetical protein
MHPEAAPLLPVDVEWTLALPGIGRANVVPTRTDYAEFSAQVGNALVEKAGYLEVSKSRLGVPFSRSRSARNCQSFSASTTRHVISSMAAAQSLPKEPTNSSFRIS